MKKKQTKRVGGAEPKAKPQHQRLAEYLLGEGATADRIARDPEALLRWWDEASSDTKATVDRRNVPKGW